jgi:hypothetical protein
MCASSRGCALLAVLALGCAAALGDDGHKAQPDPDAGFLEFLGSVDRLAEVSPEYLRQVNGAPGARPPAKWVPPPAPQSPPPRPPQPPPGAPYTQPGQNDE